MNDVIVYVGIRRNRNRTIFGWDLRLCVCVCVSACSSIGAQRRYESEFLKKFQKFQKLSNTLEKRWDRVKAQKCRSKVEIGLQSIVMEQLSMEISIRYVSQQCKMWRSCRRTKKTSYRTQIIGNFNKVNGNFCHVYGHYNQVNGNFGKSFGKGNRVNVRL